MENKGHYFFVSNRNEKIINNLLDYYDINHYTRNKRPTKKNIFKAALYLLQIILFVFKMSLKKKPDVYLGFASSACAIIAYILNKPCVIIDDTEHNTLNHRLYKKKCSKILTPFYFEKNMGDKQERFNAYVEQFYLRSTYYKKNDLVLKELNIKPYKYILLRYIAYDANHDREVCPISEGTKKRIIVELSKKYKVLISCESSVANEFYSPYLFDISPEKMHDLIAFARYFISEGATMACEAGLLGTPYLYINPLSVGYINMQTKTYSHASKCTDENTILSVIEEKLSIPWTENERLHIQTIIEEDTIDLTKKLVDMF
jgi:predicted glycosyltransferase